MVFPSFTENKQSIQFRHLLCPEWPWVLPVVDPLLFWALQGPPGARSSQPRESRRSQRASGTHWCHDLPERTTRTPPLDRQNASKAPQLPHSECPKCPQTVSSSPSEATKATTNPNADTTASIQVTEARFAPPTPSLSITTPTPAGRARPAQLRRASGPELGGFLREEAVGPATTK